MPNSVSPYLSVMARLPAQPCGLEPQANAGASVEVSRAILHSILLRSPHLAARRGLGAHILLKLHGGRVWEGGPHDVLVLFGKPEDQMVQESALEDAVKMPKYRANDEDCGRVSPLGAPSGNRYG